VSVLFCDLVGFTAASEVVDPEDVRTRLRPYHARLRDEIERFGGTVEKFVGDAVMAVFGVPASHEDDAERSVRAALRILEAIADLNRADPILGLQVRVGINTGEAVVSLDVRPESGEGFVAGDVVNTASRLQGVAPVDGVAVSESTYRQTERVFEYEALEPVVVKGKREALSIFQPLRPRGEFGRDVIRTHTTSLVGRNLEKSLLIGTFERAAQQRSCQLVTLVGEPGVGKSRMCAELLRHSDDQPDLVRWRQGRCLPYGDGIAFWALGEIVKAECGILESDTPLEVADKLEHKIPESDPERAWLMARLAPLVGVPAGPAGQEESFAAWRRFCEGLAAERTTVLVFEDLHWADSALLAFLEYLADWAEDVPLLLLCTARPELYERHATFGSNARNAQRINLGPLNDMETAQLVSALMERAVLPAETQQTLLERAGGNPLFAEEFVRLLTDRRTDAVEVPDSVQALIAARLDTLSPERKSLLQDASVLGKVFWSGAVAAMSGRGQVEVEQAMHELARKELVRAARTSSMEGEHEYGFWHVLVRDVCYGQIPRAVRAERHQEAAAWLESKAGERVEDLADVLAYHYQAALELSEAVGVGDPSELRGQAVRYLALAGERALSLDVEKAERQLAAALELASEGPARALLLERWAHAAQQQGRLPDARRALEQALALYRDQNQAVATGRVLTRLSLVRHRLGDSGSDKMIIQAVKLLEAEPPGPELVSAYSYLAGNKAINGHFAEGVVAGDQAIALADDLGLPEPPFAFNFRGFARCELDDEGGVEDIRHALQLALEQGLGRETGVVYGYVDWVAWVCDGPQASLDAITEGIAFCERRGITEVAFQLRSGRPSVLALLGHTAQALTEAESLADRLEAAGDIASVYPRCVQLWLHAERGTPQEAPSHHPLLSAAREINKPSETQATLMAAAYLLFSRGEHESARALLDELDLEHVAGAEFSYGLASLVRLALALNHPSFARRLAAAIKPIMPFRDHAIASARAQLAEVDGNHGHAARLYTEVAERWRDFGNVHEQAYSLLGAGRCLAVLNDSTAEATLVAARDLFASMGYAPALREAEALLSEAAAKTA
jgi:class 3 adenylate cyclase/tetratricopeptide (TPR) repeat protein